MPEKSLKILYTASTGAHLRSFHIPYLEALAAHGHAVTAAGAGDGRGLPEGVDFFPVPFTKSMGSPRNFMGSWRLARLMRSERFDVVITHTSLAAFFTRLGVMLAGKKHTRVVNTVHGYLFDDDTAPLRRTVMLWAEKLTAGVTDEILVMNRADEVIARKNHLCRGDVTFIDGMGVPLERFAPAAEEERLAARAGLGIPDGALVLLCAAEFSPRKNQKTLLEALALLPEDVYLLLPGRGALLEQCQEQARALGIEERVRFPGFVSDTLPFLHAADICVSASRSEGLPFHVMEAMSCGLPCVLSRVKGHEDLLDGETAGTLVPYGDAKAMAEAVKALRDDPALRERMAACARENVQRYDLPRVLPEVLALFEKEA